MSKWLNGGVIYTEKELSFGGKNQSLYKGAYTLVRERHWNIHLQQIRILWFVKSTINSKIEEYSMILFFIKMYAFTYTYTLVQACLYVYLHTQHIHICFGNYTEKVREG